MQIKVNKQYSNAFVNLLRQIILTGVDTVRPIAFQVGNTSNVLATADSVEEDMTTFIRQVCNNTYYTKTDDELVVCESVCSSVLRSGDFQPAGIAAVQEKELLHVLGEISVSVVFRNTAGSHSKEDNIMCLERNSLLSDNFIVIPSRHSDIGAFRYESTVSGDDVVYDLHIESMTGRSEAELINFAKDKISVLLQQI